jgi:hypothetical protein
MAVVLRPDDAILCTFGSNTGAGIPCSFGHAFRHSLTILHNCAANATAAVCRADCACVLQL